MVDDKLASGRLDGFRYANMPARSRHVATGAARARRDGLASAHGAESFAACDASSREAIVTALSKGELSGGAWDELDVSRAWSVCMRAILAAFYSHPWAWNEIGYGGPAYPQGYMRLGPVSTLEPHERPGATAEDPVRVASELAAMIRGLLKGSDRAQVQRLALPARRPPPRPAGPGHDGSLPGLRRG